MDATPINGPNAAHLLGQAATAAGKLHETAASASTEAQELKRLRDLRRAMLKALQQEQQRPAPGEKGVLA